jgi:hypothetical protein
MTRFIAQLNGESFINIPADEMLFDGAYIAVYRQKNLVALLDVGVVLSAYISEKEVTM